MPCFLYLCTQNKTNFMNLRIIFTVWAVLTACSAHAYYACDDTVTYAPLSGSVYTEANYGHRFHGADRNRWDFPHIVAAAEFDMGRGWAAVAEIEYERMFEDGEWCNDHHENFAVNRLLVDKTWSEALSVSIGVIGVPLGITNSGGPALTIYDPVSEAALMPMTWHEAGAVLHGRTGRVGYELAALAYGRLPVSGCRFVGLAAAAHWYPLEGAAVGIGVFGGDGCVGNLRRCSPDFIDSDRLMYGVIDAMYERDGWTADGSVIYTNCGGARSAGAEVGYDVMSSVGGGCCALVPFVRYDGVFGIDDVAFSKFTAGVGLTVLDAVTLKIEYGRVRHRGAHTDNMLDVSLGYELKF